MAMRTMAPRRGSAPLWRLAGGRHDPPRPRRARLQQDTHIARRRLDHLRPRGPGPPGGPGRHGRRRRRVASESTSTRAGGGDGEGRQGGEQEQPAGELPDAPPDVTATSTHLARG